MRKHSEKGHIKKEPHQQEQDPTIAPSMEMDELEVDASSDEIKKEESTSVTKLVIDRFE